MSSEPVLNESGARRWLLLAGLLLAALLALTPLLDNRASQQYESLFQRALVTFALARTLNGVISAVQGTELALQPAGVGITLTPGEVLDPVNDLVERFSWIMLGATISLGIQQFLLEFSAWWPLRILVVVLCAWLALAVLARRSGRGTGYEVLWRALMVTLFLRFAMPLTLLANEAVYVLFLESRYQTSTEVVTSAGQDLESLNAAAPEPEPAVEPADTTLVERALGTLGGMLDQATAGIDFSARLERFRLRATEVIEHLIQLSVVFILQTGLLPIAFLWLFLQASRWLFRPLHKNKFDTYVKK